MEQLRKQYTGERGARGAHVAVLNLATHEARPLPTGFQYVNHSPNGFEWGYLGSGPAQLAFAILLDHFQDPAPARVFYQSFKFEVIACLAHPRWELTTEQISEAINTIRQRLERETA